MAEKELLLERYQLVNIIKTSVDKKVVSLVNRNTGEKAIAKIQDASIMKNSKLRNVLHEASFTQAMQGYRGIPFMIWSGKTKDDCIVLLVEELGDTLADRLMMCKGKFSIKTACMLGIQMLEIIKSLHQKGYIHSSINLNIFQFGKGYKCQDLYINNLRQCMVYRDFRTLSHILEPNEYFRSPQSIFQSSAVYSNKEKSRKDDIESIFLVLIYLMKGKLPWSQNFKKQSNYKVVDSNFLNQFKNTKLICEGLPKAFHQILEDCRTLKFEEEPPYHWYILKLKAVLYTNELQHDYVYDWMTNKQYLTKNTMDRKIPSINLEKDEQFLKYLQENIFPEIQIDEIDIKHEFMQEIKENIKMKNGKQIQFDPYRDKPNQEADAICMKILQQQELQRKKKGKNKDDKNRKSPNSKLKQNGAKKEELRLGIFSKQKNNEQKDQEEQNGNKIRNNVLQRKRKQKSQCFIM